MLARERGTPPEAKTTDRSCQIPDDPQVNNPFKMLNRYFKICGI
jgi:hypothetical protein